MIVILVLGTFLTFILIDFFLNRKQATETPATLPASATKPALLSSASIEGFLVPDQLRYHSGHTWLVEEAKTKARVGADSLAAKSIGAIDRIDIPTPGRWVRQGQKAVTLWSGSEHIDLVSPAEGEIVEVNADVARDPSLIFSDPYGRGWLMKVNMPDPELVERNLLPRSVVRTWMKDEIRAFRSAHPLTNVNVVNER